MSNKLNKIKDYFTTRNGVFVVSIATIIGTGFGILLGIIPFFGGDDETVVPAESAEVSVQISTGEKSPVIKDTTIEGDFVIGDK